MVVNASSCEFCGYENVIAERYGVDSQQTFWYQRNSQKQTKKLTSLPANLIKANSNNTTIPKVTRTKMMTIVDVLVERADEPTPLGMAREVFVTVVVLVVVLVAVVVVVTVTVGPTLVVVVPMVVVVVGSIGVVVVVTGAIIFKK